MPQTKIYRESSPSPSVHYDSQTCVDISRWKLLTLLDMLLGRTVLNTTCSSFILSDDLLKASSVFRRVCL